MKKRTQNWTWFLIIMAMVLGLGIYLGNSRRRDPGKNFSYSLDSYRQVDESAIGYREVEPIPIELDELSALAVDDEGKLYVAGKDRIIIYPDNRRIGIDGTPTALAVGSDGMIYIGLEGKLKTISPDGDYASLNVPSDRSYITSLAVSEEYVFAADAGSRRIWRFPRDGGEAFEIGREDGPGNRGFYVPSPFFDIDLESDGSLWAVNPGYHAFEHYSAKGVLLARWENSSMTLEGFCGCCNPAHFTLLRDGSFVTAEKGLQRVKVHNPDGSFRCVVAAPDLFGDDPSGLDLAVDPQGRILVLDAVRNEVRRFEVKP
ncbi:MAG: hypothetical protein JXR25_14735 [Pontiellaceae bacterium]|nr:hypothetical protein [Pontiellaceae bacterium]MBN2786076.1 hypothetical protein [Pontiellaceae bacterium]